MAQSLTQLYVHIVFHIKYTSPEIRKTDRERLFSYIGTVINSNDSVPIKINGVEDHIHILCIQSKTVTMAKLVENIKRHSSRWIKTIDSHYESFAWQRGYGAFSVSHSVVERTKKYIEKQEQHHAEIDFKTEYLRFLNEYQIEYDEKYLWDD